MSFKKKLKFYLAGPISWVQDKSYITWREMMEKFLKSIGHEGINPLKKYAVPAKEKRKVEQAIVDAMREGQGIDVAREYLRRRIINPDYDLIDESDGIIAFIPNYSVGTSAEIGYAYRCGKPVYAVTTMSHNKWSGWFVALTTLIFASWDDLKKFLRYMSLEGV